MLRNLLRNVVYVSRRHETTLAKGKWDIHVGVLVERLPIISKKLNEIESEVMKTFTQIEFENSLKSDHEMKKEKDRVEQELLKSGKMDVDLDADTRTLQSAQDFEDLNQEELSKFKSIIAPREQPKEIENNLKCLERKLDDTLLLICEQKIDGTKVFALPQDQWKEGETLKQTAERIVKEQLGNNIQVKVYGNSPCGFYKYKYKTKSSQNSVGAKVFFYRAGHRSGNVDEKNVATFEWINNSELEGKVRKSYFESVSNMLI